VFNLFRFSVNNDRIRGIGGFVRHVIIGNGAAGTAAALNIRKTDAEADITILTDEAYPFYSRIRLIEYLAGEIAEEELAIYKPEWYEENRINLLLETPVFRIDTEGNKVLTLSDERFTYDRLLISTGGVSFVPPIHGTQKEGIFTLKTIDDAKKIIAYAEGIEDVLVIGGGVLGLEAGNALRKRGKKVSVVEFFPRLLPRQMDPDGSEVLCAQMEEMGLRFFLGAKTREILGDEKATGVLLEDGRQIEAGMILISAGIRSDTRLAEDAGIETDKRGIVVDDRMETSVKGIYAAGDVAEHRGVSYGIWPAAEKQGAVAGINMAGGNALFEGITPSNVLKVAGIELYSAGNIDAEGKCDCIVQKDKERHLYRKLVIEDGRLRGCILLGTSEGWRKILRAIDERRDISSLREELEKWNLQAL
jgi:nitrite reductase (NADH) large subunit